MFVIVSALSGVSGQVAFNRGYQTRQGCRANRGSLATIAVGYASYCALKCIAHPQCMAASITDHGSNNVECDLLDRINENLNSLDCDHENSRFIRESSLFSHHIRFYLNMLPLSQYGRIALLNSTPFVEDSTDECPEIAVLDYSVLDTAVRTVDTHVTASCTSGYILQDGQVSMVLQCQADQTWSVDITANPCALKVSLLPPAMSGLKDNRSCNALIVCLLSVRCPPIAHSNSLLSSQDTTVGSVVTVTCEAGFGLQDGAASMTLTFEDAGSWSPDYTLNPCAQCKLILKLSLAFTVINTNERIYCVALPDTILPLVIIDVPGLLYSTGGGLAADAEAGWLFHAARYPPNGISRYRLDDILTAATVILPGEWCIYAAVARC